MEYMKGRRIMELNPESPVIAKLKEQFEADPVGGAAKATAELLYETALVTSGFDVESPKDFAGRWASGISSCRVWRRFHGLECTRALRPPPVASQGDTIVQLLMEMRAGF